MAIPDTPRGPCFDLRTGMTLADRPAAPIGRRAVARLLCALLPLSGPLALPACTADQSGIRDWSIQAREVVMRPPFPHAGAADGDAALVLREAAGAWLAVLAALAVDAVSADDSAAIERRAMVLSDPVTSAAAVNLARATGFVARRNWGAAHLAHAVDHGDPFFQAVLAAIARHDAALPPAPDPGSRMARDAATTRIAAGHALLVERKFILGQGDTGRRMRAEASELRRLSAAIATAP